MTSMNISLPDALKAFVETQVSSGGYSSASEYVRELLRTEQRRHAKEALELELLEALRSGDPVEVTPEMIEETHQRLRARATARKAE
jgi:antitoxin ParD1/3/4